MADVDLRAGWLREGVTVVDRVHVGVGECPECEAAMSMEVHRATADPDDQRVFDVCPSCGFVIWLRPEYPQVDKDEEIVQRDTFIARHHAANGCEWCAHYLKDFLDHPDDKTKFHSLWWHVGRTHRDDEMPI